MRPYETAFLIAPNLPEEETEKLIEKMAGIISKKKGKMVHLDKWGKRKLAYPIKKFEEAFYVFFLYEGEPSIPAELERIFKQTETVIRYLTIKLEEKENFRRKKKTQARPDEAAGKRRIDREESDEGETIFKEEPEEITPEVEERKDASPADEEAPQEVTVEKSAEEETEQKVSEETVKEKGVPKKSRKSASEEEKKEE